MGVARNTVREALDVLEARKVIKRRPGSGSFPQRLIIEVGELEDEPFHEID